MKGHIKERSPGRWAIILDQYDANGKRHRKWHSFKGTKRQAQTKCSQPITEMESGEYVEPAKTTLAQFLERWLKHIKPNVSPRTHERYEQIATKNIGPLLGSKTLSKLQPIEISEAYAQALESGRRDGKGGLSPRTVHYMHRVLYSALNQAERWKLINRNPAALLEKRDRPKIERKPVTTIDAATTATVFDTARERRLFIPLPGAGRALRSPPWRDNRPALAVDRSGHRPACRHCQHGTDRRRRYPGEGSQERPRANGRPALSGRRGIAALAGGASRGSC
jgi:hypothetical protein